MNIPKFIENNIKIADKPIKLYSYQKKILQDDNEFRIINKSRQIGLTQTISWESLVYALAEPNHLIIITSASQKNANDVMRYIKDAYYSLPDKLKRDMTCTKEDMNFSNNSRIMSLPNNPRCYSDDTELLTENGWKLFSELKNGEKVAQVDKDTHIMTFVVPTDFIGEHYVGNMIEIKDRVLDILVTPNHRMLLMNYDKKSRKIRNAYVEEARKISHYDNNILKAVNFDGRKINKIHFKADSKQTKSITLDGDSYCKFMGLYLSEGSATYYKPHGSYLVKIAQFDGYKKDLMTEILKDTKLKFSIKKDGFHIYSKPLYMFLKGFGKCNVKYVPNEIKNASSKQMRMFLDCFLLGDGSIKNNRARYSTNSKRLADDMQEMLLKIGMGVNIKQFPYEKGKTKGIMYHINEQITKFWKYRKIGYFNRRDHIREKHYDGMIYCVGVPTGFIVVRRNGKALVCGNTVRGRPATRVYVDEFSSFQDDDEMWKSIMPSISRGGKITILSTPKGKRGKFYEFWANAEDLGWSKYEIPWKECPDIKKRIKIIRQGMPDQMSFDQEFSCKFIDEAVSYFPWELILGCVDDNLIENKIVPDDNMAYMGVDFGKIIDSSVMVYAKKRGLDFAVEYIKEFKPPLIYKEVSSFILQNFRRWKLNRIVVDQTGVGEKIIEDLSDLGSSVIGNKLTGPFKEKIISNLKIVMQDGRLRIPRDETLMLQLHALERKYTETGGVRYSHPNKGSTQHDDYVWALAMCIYEGEESGIAGVPVYLDKPILRPPNGDEFRGFSGNMGDY